MVKFQNMPRLIEMEALLPIDKYIDAWAGRGDISDDLWKLHIAPDGKRYYLPLQYVVLYLYVRQDWFAQQNLPMPTTFDTFLKGAKALTTTDRWGFGLRGGSGGHDFWATFVLGGGARMEKGGLVTPAALAANNWFIDLHVTDHVTPPSAPTDGFLQTDQQHEGGPHRHDDPPYRIGERTGGGPRRRDHRHPRAARAAGRRLDHLRRRLQRRLRRLQEPATPPGNGSPSSPPAPTTRPSQNCRRSCR